MRRQKDLYGTEDRYRSSAGAAAIEADEDFCIDDSASTEARETDAAETMPGGDESLGRYFREVSRWNLLSPEAERALAVRTAKGDPAALEEMVTRNLRLVVYWAKRYRASGMPIQDLIQEGNIGLMRAAEKFDYRKGTRFSTYASWWIRQGLARAVCDRHDLIRIPVHMHQKMRIVDRMLESTGAHASSQDDIEASVDDMGIIPFKDWESTRRLQQSVSLDRRPNQDRDVPIDVEDRKAVNPLREVHMREMRERVAKMLHELPSRYQTVLKLRYGLDGGDEQTLESIGARLHLSRERVRQIQTDAIALIAARTGLPRLQAHLTRRPAGRRTFTGLPFASLLRSKPAEVRATGRRSSAVTARSAAATGSARSRG